MKAVAGEVAQRQAHQRTHESWRRRVVGTVFRGSLSRAGRRQVPDGSLPLSGIHRILVIRPNHRLGNMLLLTPLITALERVYPGAEVDLLVGAEIARDVFAGFDRVRRMHCVTSRMARHPLRLVRILRELRRSRYDLVVDAGLGSQSGRIFAGMVQGQRLLGVTDADSGSAALPNHFSHRPVQALARVLADGHRLIRGFPPLSLRLAATEREQGRRILDMLLRPGEGSDDAPVVGLFANATGAKRLDLAWWMSFIDHLSRLRPDVRMVELLPAYGESPLKCRVPTLFSTDIRAMGAVAAQMDCFVSADCGVMHLAAAAGVPTFGLFARTRPELYGPTGPHSRSFVTPENTPEDVAEAVVEHLAAARSSKPSDAV